MSLITRDVADVRSICHRTYIVTGVEATIRALSVATETANVFPCTDCASIIAVYDFRVIREAASYEAANTTLKIIIARTCNGAGVIAAVDLDAVINSSHDTADTSEAAAGHRILIATACNGATLGKRHDTTGVSAFVFSSNAAAFQCHVGDGGAIDVAKQARILNVLRYLQPRDGLMIAFKGAGIGRIHIYADGRPFLVFQVDVSCQLAASVGFLRLAACAVDDVAENLQVFCVGNLVRLGFRSLAGDGFEPMCFEGQVCGDRLVEIICVVAVVPVDKDVTRFCRISRLGDFAAGRQEILCRRCR